MEKQPSFPRADSLQQDASSRNGAVFLLCLVTLLSLSLWFSASAIVPQLRVEWGLSLAMQAWMTMSVQIGFVLGAVGSALLNLADRIPAPKMIAVGALAGALANGLIPVVDAPLPALVLRVLTGACLACVYPPGMKVMASWCRERRGTCIGLLVGAVTIGSGMPHLLNALATDAAGIPPWRQVLFGTSIQALAASLIAFKWLRSGPFLPAASGFNWRHALVGLSSRAPRMANFGYFGHMWELYAVWAWAPLMLGAAYRNAGWDPDLASYSSFGIFLVGGLACFLAGRWADRLGRTLITTGALVLSGLCSLTVGLFFYNPILLTVVCLIWGFAVIADSAQFSTAISELSDARFVGTALQVQTSIGFLLTMVTLQIIPVLIDLVGYRWAFLVLVPGPVFGAMSMLRLRTLPESRRMASGRR